MQRRLAEIVMIVALCSGIAAAQTTATSNNDGMVKTVPTDTGRATPSDPPIFASDSNVEAGTSPYSALGATSINIRAQGATGDGHADDTSAIVAAISACTSAGGGVVSIPQGTYRITSPLSVTASCSLVGAGEGSVILADFSSWAGAPYAINMVYSGKVSDSQLIANRQLANFTLKGENNASLATWGIYEANTSNVDAPNYQLTNWTFQNLSIAQFDTAIEAQDLVASAFENCSITAVRQGIVFNGNVVNIAMESNQIQYASWSFTPTHTASTGILLENNSKYTSGSEGTYPEGIQINMLNTILSFDTLINLSRGLAIEIEGDILDSGGAGPAGSGSGISIGNGGDGYEISHNYIASANASSPAITMTNTLTNGWKIKDNSVIQCYAGSGTGVLVNGTGNTINNGDLSGNNFVGCTNGVLFKQGMRYGLITHNMGHNISSALINLTGAASLSFAGTFIEKNIDADAGVAVVAVGDATGYQMGQNFANGSGANPGATLNNTKSVRFTGGGQLSDDGTEQGGINASVGSNSSYGFRFWLGNAGGTSLGQIDPSGNWHVGTGANVVYRCTGAGSLPVGALTIQASDCGASSDTGLRVK
jgi:hypothetical protein